MTLFKSQQTGTWQVRFESPQGERTVDTGTAQHGEARARCAMARIAELETAAAAGRLNAQTLSLIGSGRQIDLAEALRQYGEWAHQEHAPKTVVSTMFLLGKFIRQSVRPTMAPGQVTREQVADFINDPELRLSTRLANRSRLCGFFQFCIDQGWMLGNPAARAPIRYQEIPLELKEQRRRRLFSPVDLEYLIANLEGFWKAAVIFGSEMGLRLSDVCCLEWGSLDLKRGQLTLWMQKTNRRWSQPMPVRVQRLAVGLEQKDPRWVFPDEHRCWVRSQSTLSHQFKRLCKKHDLKGHSFHDLRATYATRRYREMRQDPPVDMAAMGEVARALGHRSSMTTQRHYVQ